MVVLTRTLQRNRVRRVVGLGTNHQYMRGDGFGDWLKGAFKKVVGFVKPILAPVLGIAKNVLLPSAMQAITTGDKSQLKKGLINTFKQAMPGIMDRTSQQVFKEAENLPESVKQYVPVTQLQDLSKFGQDVINKKVQEIKGEGVKRKKREKKLDKLVRGSGLLNYK
jgi:hypothetical protein